MENKEIIKTTFLILLVIFLVFIFYLIFVKPHVTRTYMPKEKDCKKAYNCLCVEDSCICTYKKWFIENKMTCAKNFIKEEQLKNK